MTLIEMAEAVVELTASRSEVVFEALPVDDPKVRQPDIARARDLLGWQPEVSVREGLERTISAATPKLEEALASGASRPGARTPTAHEGA
jgi:nucleoside-diphosphate-sugar epimerase